VNKIESNWGTACVLMVALIAAPAGAGEFTLGGGVDYSSGKYGTGEATDILYVPLNAKYESGASTFKLTLPYVRITAPVGGTLVGVDAQGRPIYAGGGTRKTQEGQGDVVASYVYSLVEKPVHGFLVDVTAKIKFATADAAKELGSGKNDYTALTDVFYLAGAWTPFATVSYRVTGDPAGSNLKNVWGATLGLGYKQSPADSLGLMWDIRQASTVQGVESNEATAYWVHKFGGGIKLQTYLVKGFSHGSADWGLGAMFSKTFGK
jgi:hypothetical protein